MEAVAVGRQPRERDNQRGEKNHPATGRGGGGRRRGSQFPLEFGHSQSAIIYFNENRTLEQSAFPCGLFNHWVWAGVNLVNR